MLTVEIVNDGTGTNTIGNYDYRVIVGGNVIDSGRVESHMRLDGWTVLLHRVAERGEINDSKRMYEAVAALLEESARA